MDLASKKNWVAQKGPALVDILDTVLWIDESGMIQSDLFVKECKKVTYLLPSSCHAGHVTKNIPHSLGYRLKADMLNEM